jgi:hypothetical protein
VHAPCHHCPVLDGLNVTQACKHKQPRFLRSANGICMFVVSSRPEMPHLQMGQVGSASWLGDLLRLRIMQEAFCIFCLSVQLFPHSPKPGAPGSARGWMAQGSCSHMVAYNPSNIIVQGLPQPKVQHAHYAWGLISCVVRSAPQPRVCVCNDTT